ncbi:hypothetical protein G5I_11793 [Acromyrmex echinatior]|uniref:Uncharacterized protein n=1 Tax=Acromyrmex echinatior TaxID=103372 RepID=F4X0L3_ACREC|nr:hypothetical protein G5I_11793 [Acromyrmex echinatior]
MIQFWMAVLREDTTRRSVGDTGTEYSHYALKWRRKNCDSREYSRLGIFSQCTYITLALKLIALKLLLYKCLIHMMMSHVKEGKEIARQKKRLQMLQLLRAGDAVFFFNDKCGRYAKYSTFPPYFDMPFDNHANRICILNSVGLADTQKRVINCDNLQSSFRINLALDYQQRRGLTVSSVDFHWAGNSVRESNQSAVDATHLGLHAGSRDAFSGRPYAGKLDHRARKRMACNQCAFSNV